MADRTDFLGLTRLLPGESIASDGYGLQDRNPTLLDYISRLVINHRHDAHAALVQADPPVDPVASTANAGGSIPAGATITVGYTLLDQDGGETLLNANPQSVTTDPGLVPPDVPPALALEITAGTLLAGDYSYAVTVTDGLGGETTLSPQAELVIPPGSANNQIRVTDLSAVVAEVSGAGWRLWRAVNGAEWHLMATGDAADDEFLDDGSTAADCGVSPPVTTTASGSNMLTVTVPSPQPAAAVQFRIYASLDGTFTGDCLLGTYDVSQLDQAQDFITLAFEHGSPPDPATALPGAEHIQGGGGASLPGYPGDFALGLHGPGMTVNPDGSANIYDGVNYFTLRFDSTGYRTADDRLAPDPTDTYSFNADPAGGEAHYSLSDAKQMGEGSVTLQFELTADPGQSLAVLVGAAALPGGRRLYAKYVMDASPYHYLSLVVWDPVNGEVTNLTDVDGSSEAGGDMHALDLNTPIWLRYSVTGISAKAEVFDVDPAVGAPLPWLSFQATAKTPEELSQIIYGGPPAFGWANTGVPPDTLHLLDIAAHAESPGYVMPPPTNRPKVNGIDLDLTPYPGAVSWYDDSGLAVTLRPRVEEYGAVLSVEKVQDFSDAFVLNGDEFQSVTPGSGIDAVNGYLVEIGDLNQYVGMTWLPDPGGMVAGDFIWAAKVNRPDGAHLGGMVIMRAAGGSEITAFDMPDGQTFNFDGITDYDGPGLLMRNPYQFPAPPNLIYFQAAVQAPVGDTWNVLRREAGVWRFERWSTDPFAAGAPDYFVESPATDAWNPYPVRLDFQAQYWREQGGGTFAAPAITVARVDELRLRRKPRRCVLVASANAEDGTGAIIDPAIEQVIVTGG